MPDFSCKGKVTSIIIQADKIQFTLRSRISYVPKEHGVVNDKQVYNIFFDRGDRTNTTAKVETKPFEITDQIADPVQITHFTDALYAAKTEDAIFIFDETCEKLQSIHLGDL